MLFWYPYRFDLPLAKTPKATYFVAAVCVLIFVAQIVNKHYFEKGIQDFCTTYTDKSFFEFITSFKGTNTNEKECFKTIQYFHDTQENDKNIWEYSRNLNFPADYNDVQKKLAIQNTYTMYRKAYDVSKEIIPVNIRAYFEYRAGSYNPITAITSNFLHGDIWHIGGNLLFFIAFGSVVELVISSYITYTIIILLSSLTIGFIWSLSSIYTPSWTSIGLSGVVSVMMGIAVYIVPTGRIRCAYLFGLKAGTVSISLLWLFIWFFAWDIYYLLSFEHSGINNIAHVTGMIFGYLWAKKYYKDDKDRLKAEIDNEYSRIRLSRIEKIGILEGIRNRKM